MKREIQYTSMETVETLHHREKIRRRVISGDIRASTLARDT